jgi:clan AA aspartic protease (TIGR02281 family)
MTPSDQQILYAQSVTSPTAALSESDAIGLTRRPDGLFHLKITLDGYDTMAIFDTGASHSVISQDLLERISKQSGKKIEDRSPNGAIKTLTGQLNYRFVRIDNIKVEGLEFSDFKVAVVRGENVPTILGQDVISKFNSIKIESGQLTLN